jgi:hypothetical protein
MPETKRPLKVFLCHAHYDATAVYDLYRRLRREGVAAWLDKESLLPGQDWDLEIRRAVREADVVVVCLSKQFNQAGYRQKEVRIALEAAMEQPEGEIFIIPLRLEECENLESLKKWHWVDLFADNGYQRLIQALRIRADRIGATLRIRGGRPSITDRPKNKEPETMTDGTSNIPSKSHIPKIFISYSHKDEKYKDELVKMLRPLEDQRILEIWQDREIQPGEEWSKSIKNAMNTCDIALLLISVDFLASRFILEEEIPTLLRRRLRDGLRVVPIIIRPCLWQSVPVLAELQALPKDGKPIVSFASAGARRDRVWTEVALAIKSISEHLAGDRVVTRTQGIPDKVSKERSIYEPAPPEPISILVESFPAPGSKAEGITWDGISLWLSDNSGTIFKMSPSGKVLDSIRSPEVTPQGLTWDGSSLWVYTTNHSLIYQIRIAGENVQTISSFRSPAQVLGGGITQDMAWDGENLWYANQFKVYRLDGSGKVLGSFTFHKNVTGLDWDGSNLWIAYNNFPEKASLSRVDMHGETLEIYVSPILEINSLAWADRDLWALGSDAVGGKPMIYKLSLPAR